MESLSPLYRNFPFLTLNKMQHNAFQKSTEDVTNFENSSIYDEEIPISAPCDDLNIPLPKANQWTGFYLIETSLMKE